MSTTTRGQYIQCPDCRKRIPDYLVICEACGDRREARRNPQTSQPPIPTSTYPSASSSLLVADALGSSDLAVLPPSAFSLQPLESSTEKDLESSGEKEEKEPPQLPLVRELLALHAQRRIEPEPVRLGPLPDNATRAMKAVAADIELRLGLLLHEGITRPLQYARSEAVRAGIISTPQGASYVLHRLEDDGVIVCVGEMQPTGGRRFGARLFVPPGWRPASPNQLAVAVELGNRREIANLVWVPDEPDEIVQLTAVDPCLESADQSLVGLHGASAQSGTPGSITGRVEWEPGNQKNAPAARPRPGADTEGVSFDARPT